MPTLHPVSVPNLDLPEATLRLSVWHCREGAPVRDGDRLVEITAGDVVVDLSAPADGLVQRLAVEDDVVQVGQVIANIQLKILLWWLTLGAILSPAMLPGAESAAATRINVVIILADDLGWGDLGCYGHPKFKTPNLDRMAAEGARLTNFYAACPFCAPTRAALMTGRYPHRCGMTGNPVPAEDYGVKGNRSGDELGLPQNERTLGEVFQTAEYQTACIGKWHLGHKPQFLPTRVGFHQYFGIPYSNDMNPVVLLENEKQVEFPVNQRTLTRRYTERAVKFIEENKDRPFFLYFPQAMPHKPLAASDAFYQKSGAGLYGDAVAELDWSVGQVLDKLKQAGLDNRTLVFFTSDNGPWFGGSTGGLRGMKSQCWEGGIRVPLIARWPGVIPPGHVSHEPAIMMDLHITSRAAARIAPRQESRPLDGANIMPLLTSDAKSPHEALLAVQGQLRTIRMGPWKLHVKGTPPIGQETWTDDWVDPRRPDGTTIIAQEEQAKPSAFPGLKTGDRSTAPALFNLQDDPGEQKNVADQHPEVVTRLLAKFAELAK
jgi:arylsulfatase A-like enzyme